MHEPAALWSHGRNAIEGTPELVGPTEGFLSNRPFPGAGPNSNTLARFQVKPEEFVQGENRFEIVEAPRLVAGGRGLLNDSLIRSVRVTLR